MSEIKVLMVGASRSGKSSILASMMRECQLYLSNYNLELNGVNGQTAADFNDSIASMMELCNNTDNTNPRMTALYGTQDLKEYRFGLSYLDFPDKGATQIVVYDVPGEYYQTADGRTKLQEYAQQCQILIVAIDTPALIWLSGRRDQNYENLICCIDALRLMVNNLGTAIDQNRPDDNKCLKSLIFAPIKCESNIRSNEVKFKSTITRDIKNYYDNILTNTRVTNGRFKVSIIPMETIGGIQFDHYSEEEKMKLLYYNPNRDINDAKLYEETDNDPANDGAFTNQKITRCEVFGNGVRIARTGSFYTLQDGDTLKNPIEKNRYPYVYYASDTIKKTIPYIWYKPTENGQYEPKNCNKVLFEIIKLTIQQVAADFIKKRYKNNINDIFNMQQNGFARLWNLLVTMLGFNPPIANSVQLQELCKALRLMEQNGEFDYAITLQNRIDQDGSPLKINQ